MFGDLSKFLDKSFFDSHKYGDLYYSQIHHGLAFFGVLQADAYDSSIYRTKVAGNEIFNYLDKLRSKCMY